VVNIKDSKMTAHAWAVYLAHRQHFNLEIYFIHKTILKISVGYSEANCKIAMSKKRLS
jgi:hypothetical protein